MDKLFFTEEHEMLRDMVRDFAENEVEPLAREMDKTENIPKGLIDKMGELGILGIPVPEKYGGVGMYGNNVHKAVLENKEVISGITIHLVNEKYDDGEVLFQKSCAVFSGETVASLSKKITKLEHLFFPEIIKAYLRK